MRDARLPPTMSENPPGTALHAAALAVSGSGGQAVFDELVRFCSDILHVDAAMISIFADAGRARMRTLASCLDGRPLASFEYDLANTPCAGVIGRDFRFVGSGALPEFAAGGLFGAKGMDSYAAYSLVAPDGAQLGLIAVMDREPLPERALVESVLKIFSVRAVAELERSRAAAALEASEASYRAIFEATEDAVFVHDWDTGAILDVNPKACEMTGYSAAELRRMTPGDFAGNRAPYTREEALRHIEAAKTGGPVRFQWPRRRKDGALHWDEVTLKAATIGGRPRILAFTRDVTERKRAEEALKASEEQYRAIFNASEDAMMLWNSEPRRVDVNPAYLRMYGVTREEVLDPEYGSALPIAHAARRMDYIRRTLAGERCSAEVEAVRKDGTRFQIDLRTIPVRHLGEPHALAIGRDITERRIAEEALKSSEEQYRAIFNASDDAMVLWNSSLRRVDVNPAYERLFGYPREEALAPDRHAALPRKYVEQREDIVRRTLAGERCHAELDAIRRDGAMIQIEVRTVPVRHRGEPHVLAMVRDITARRRSEEALKASEAQYRAIFNATEDALVLRDANFRIVDVNQAYERLSGYSRAEVIGVDRVIANPGIQEQIRGLHARAIGGEPFMVETVRQRKDGALLDVELRGVPIRHRGEPHVLYIGRDISMRKRAEEIRRASEEQYRAIFDATADAIVVADTEGRIVDVNPALLKLSGYRREEVLGEHGWMMVAPEHVKLDRQMHERVVAGEAVQYELTGVGKSGERRDIEVHGVPMRYRGQPHTLSMARDITARKRASEERLSLERQLRQAQKMEAIGHLTGGIAHDFNNLLAAIMGYVALAAEKLEDGAPADPRKLAGYLDEALLGCRRARDLVQQMLTFSRGQRGTPRPLALREAVAESLKLVRSSLPATIEIRSDPGADAPAVLFDPVQLDQVMLNLSINARDAMEGSGRLTVSTRKVHGLHAVCSSCRKSFRGDFAELAVEDAGPGIAPEVMERMFEPFFTTKEVGRGSGMGLATVHGIVHEHGGHIVVDPGRVVGTRFRMLLPVLAGAQPQLPPAPRAAAPARREALKGRVLIVDDEAGVARFMQELLEGWGLSASAATNPASAARLFAADPAAYDLVITDQMMPGRSGVSLAKELLALRADLPVVLYSGHMDRATEAESRAAGIRAVLAKPVEPEVLYGILKTHLH
jgi:PAS domain S-box-containing protein